jgi:hypothetical protein
MWGKGISRYEDSNTSDFVVRSAAPAGFVPGDKNFQPIKSFSAIFGLETHPTKKFEFNIWGGDEYYYRTTYTLPSLTAGAPGVVEGYGSANAASTRNLLEGSAVVWYDVYKGAFGTLRYGAQYEYIYRGTWSADGERAFKGINNVGMLAMRYIIS